MDVLVSEVACSGGRDTAGLVLPSRVELTAETVTITLSVAPLAPDSAYTCQGNPSTTFTVELGEPLGDRALLDGRFFSARPPGETG